MKNLLFLLFAFSIPLTAIAEEQKISPVKECAQCRERKTDTCTEECLKVEERKSECIEFCISEYCEHKCEKRALPTEFTPEDS